MVTFVPMFVSQPEWADWYAECLAEVDAPRR